MLVVASGNIETRGFMTALNVFELHFWFKYFMQKENLRCYFVNNNKKKLKKKKNEISVSLSLSSWIMRQLGLIKNVKAKF